MKPPFSFRTSQLAMLKHQFGLLNPHENHKEKLRLLLVIFHDTQIKNPHHIDSYSMEYLLISRKMKMISIQFSCS